MRWRTFWRQPVFWLVLMVAAFVSISFYSAVVTYDNFGYVNSNSANNAGIVTQAVASTTFGHHAPFYESWDCMHSDRCSFMLIHTGFILYLAAPFYAAAPSTVTLFALQSVVLGAAAIPLYWLTRQVTNSTRKALFSAGLYLIWAPVFSAFTLHLEALLPVELIGLTALWQAQKYRWGLLLSLVAFLTMEVAPIFVFLIGLFFLLELFPLGLKYLRMRVHLISIRRAGERVDEYVAQLRSVRRTLWTSRKLRATLLLMGFSVLALLVLFSFRNLWGFQVLGVVRPPVTSGAGGLFYDGVGATVAPFSFVITSAQTQYTAEYWLIIFGLVAFLPVLAPRSLVISLPWVLYTFLSQSTQFYTIGLEETVVVAGPIFIGVAYGLRLVSWRREPQETSGPQLAEASATRPARATALRARHGPTLWKTTVVAVFGCLVVANALLSPIDPVLPALGYEPGPPFVAGYFDHSLGITSGIVPAENMVAEIPMNATIAANSIVFPLVANHPDAVVFLPNAIWQPFENPAAEDRLPFNVTNGPQFVFVESSFLTALKSKFYDTLSNSSDYGLRAYVSSTAIGPLLLYQQVYNSTAQRFGPELSELNGTYGPHAGLRAGTKGTVAKNSSAPGGEEIQSLSGKNASGEIWTGPGVFLPSGSYTVRIEISAQGAIPKNASSPVLRVVGVGFGAMALNLSYPGSAFASGAWTTITANFTTTSPVPLFDLKGYLLNPKVPLAVASVSVWPATPG